jgi:hypothetical protein
MQMNEIPNITPIRPMDEAGALAWLRDQPGSRTDLPQAELARRWACQPYTVSRWLQRWRRDGVVAQQGRSIVAVEIEPPQAAQAATSRLQQVEIKEELTDPLQHIVAVRNAAREAATVGTVAGSLQPTGYPFGLVTRSWPGTGERLHTPLKQRSAVADVLASAVAVGLAAVTAYFSVRGMVTLFPGLTVSIIALAIALESSKLVGIGWLAANWRHTALAFRVVLATLVVTMAGINAVSVYSQLVAGHVGQTALTAGAHNMEIADADARIEVASAKLTDIDRRISAIDAIVAGAAQRGHARTAASVLDEQRKDRAGLVTERQRAADALADLKVKRAAAGEGARIAAVEAAPVMYVSQLFGATDDPEAAIRWLILAMTLCADPMSLMLCAAVSARRSK